MQDSPQSDPPNSGWTFLTNHAAVLLHIAAHPDDTVLSIASAVGLRERTTAAIIADLKDAGYLTSSRRGRHNHYAVNLDLPLRRAAHSNIPVKELISALTTLTRARNEGASSESDRAVASGTEV